MTDKGSSQVRQEHKPTSNSGEAKTSSSSSNHHPQQFSPHQRPESISVTVAPFTGGPFSLSVSRSDSVDDLKKAVAKKLKVLKDRICLLYRERYVGQDIARAGKGPPQ